MFNDFEVTFQSVPFLIQAEYQWRVINKRNDKYYVLNKLTKMFDDAIQSVDYTDEWSKAHTFSSFNEALDFYNSIETHE